MRILFTGDVVGRSGREALKQYLPQLKEKLSPDIIISNVDNAAGGRGVTKETAKEIYAMGVDCLTGGDHIWDQREMVCAIENDQNLLRALNLPATTPGRGVWSRSLPNGHEIVVIHLCGTIFMTKTFDSAFDAINQTLSNFKIGQGRSIFVDIHAEATSEKMALAHYLDGRVSAVVGTHTHIPTADAHILKGGTAFQGDAGMCGDYDSVIGVIPDVPIANFLRQVPLERMSPANGHATLCGSFIKTDDKTGLAKNIAPVRIGGILREEIPDF